MATLYVRARTLPDGGRRFDVKYRRGGRYTPLEHGGTFKTRREALIRREVLGDMLAAGLNPKVELARIVTAGRPIGIVADEWLAGRRSLAPGTRRGYGFRQAVIVEGFRQPVDEISVDDVIGWVGELERDYKPGTVRLFVQQLRMILDHADLPLNPARSRKVELPRNIRSEPQPPDAGAVLAALQAVSDISRLPLLTMEQLGTRVTETIELTLNDLDIAGGRVLIRRERAKGGHGRWIPTSDLLLDALSERLPFAGSRHSPTAALRTVSAGFHPHDLRHRRASLWHQQGLPAVELAARLGHARPSMSLDVYSHVQPLQELGPHDLASLLR